jgi:Reverse transcriptase (RNA-dependent DNA polymerase)
MDYSQLVCGLCWHQRFTDLLRSLGFKQCKSEGDILMRLNGDAYEYIVVYVDDLLIAAKDPLAITKCLEETPLKCLEETPSSNSKEQVR